MRGDIKLEKRARISWTWRQTPFVLAFTKTEQEDLYEFDTSVVYILNSRLAKPILWDTVLEIREKG